MSYESDVKRNRGASMFARDSYSSRITPLKEDEEGNYRGFNSKHSFNPDLDTPEGLYKLANQAGLGDQANQQMRKVGGETQKFFSGGFIMDALDVLNIGSYGMAGLLKGKGFKEGIKNRDSFSDEDALGKYGWQGKLAGLALDIVLDPLTYFAPLKHITKIPGVNKVLQMADSKLFGELKTITIEGQKAFKREGGWTPTRLMAEKLVYGFAADRTFLNGTQKEIGKAESMVGDAENLVTLLSKLVPRLFKSTLARGDDGRVLSANLDELARTHSPEQMAKIAPLYKMRDDLMQKLIDNGVITKETADEHWGTYLKQSYDEYLTAKNTIPGKKGVGITNQGRNKDLTKEVIERLGPIEDPSVIWAMTFLKQIDLIKKSELQKLTSDGYALTSDMLAAFTAKGGKVADLHHVGNDPTRYGKLANKFVSKEVWDVLKGTFDPTKELGESLVLGFKHMKVVWNPASHARNAVSATVQNWWRMGIGPWRVDTYYDAWKELKTLKLSPDQQGKHIKMMKDLGFNENSGAIREILDNYLGNKLVGEQLKSQLGKTPAEVKRYLKHIDGMMMRSYGHMDNVAKVAAFKHGLKQGMNPEDALKAAYEATFNYSEVTPFVHRMRRAIWGVPFITFALKSVPLVKSTLVHAPHRISVFGKARNDLFKAAGIEGEQESEVMPDYMRDNLVMRLPWKDEKGRSMYFDLTYIIPFGAILTGEYMPERGNITKPLQQNPVLQLVKELSQNKTFSGHKIFNQTDDIETVGADLMIHLSKLALPPIGVDQLPLGYDQEGKRAFTPFAAMRDRETQDFGPNERSYYQEAFRIAGMGVSPYDLQSKERNMAYKQKEGLTKLLTERGILKEFRNPYLPKGSEFKQPENLYDRDVTPIGR